MTLFWNPFGQLFPDNSAWYAFFHDSWGESLFVLKKIFDMSLYECLYEYNGFLTEV